MHAATDTSIVAMRKINSRAASIRPRVIAELAKVGASGLTTTELSALLGDDYRNVQPQTSVLRSQGHINDSGSRRLNDRGNREIVWVAAATVA